jgi:hypothetical protein
VVLLCGRFEGIDARVLEARDLEEISIGDFVLSGGEPAAMCLIDACVRLLPGVVGKEASLGEESFGDGDYANLLEYPHYTKPAEWDGRTVPEFQRTLLAVGGATVRAMFGPANFALILRLLQCSCRIRRALSTPASPRKHTFTLIQPHSTSRPSLPLRSPSSPSPPLFPSPTSSFTCA